MPSTIPQFREKFNYIMLKSYLRCAKLEREKLILDLRLEESAKADLRQTIREG